jgi:hypothetical protein
LAEVIEFPRTFFEPGILKAARKSREKRLVEKNSRNSVFGE